MVACGLGLNCTSITKCYGRQGCGLLGGGGGESYCQRARVTRHALESLTALSYRDVAMHYMVVRAHARFQNRSSGSLCNKGIVIHTYMHTICGALQYFIVVRGKVEVTFGVRWR